MSNTPANTPTVKFTNIIGDEYEIEIRAEVTVDGHPAGEIDFDDIEDCWFPSPMLVREMESLDSLVWARLEDAKSAVTIAAGFPLNRCARLHEQRLRLESET